MDKVKEQISAMVDDELDTHEMPFLLKRLTSDAALAQSIPRYQVISQMLRQDHTPITVDLLGRINQSIDADPEVDEADAAADTPTSAPKKRSMFEQVAGVAVAASVAMITIWGVQTLPNDPDTEQVAATATTATTATGTFWQSDQPVVEARLNTYLVKHNQNVVPAFRGPMNVHLVGYDGGQSHP